ncbi:MAG: serine/threonine-protein kinase [Planctomycetota bacterium]
MTLPPTRRHFPIDDDAERSPCGASLGEATLVLERFVLVREVSRGAQGTVWQARDRVACCDVAVKILPGLTHDDVVTMGREVAALRLLKIPGVVPLIDAGAHGACGCVAMEWIDGSHFPSASERTRWERLEPALRSLLGTLERVHSVGIVHRDLKPANVIVDGDARATLLDLGVAGGTALTSDGPEPLAGTPRYMAPVLFRGAAPSPATDLYALAVMVYEALTGEPLRSQGAESFFDPDPLDHARVERDLQGHAPSPIVRALVRILGSSGTYTGGHTELMRALGASSGSPASRLAPVVARLARTGSALTPVALEALFDAEERIVAHRSTAARLLHEEVEGDVGRVLARVETWLGLGIGRLRGHRLSVDELDVERRERRREMRGLVGQGALTTTWLSRGLLDLAETAFREIDERIAAGELREALAELPNILSTFDQLDHRHRIPPVLYRWLRVALFANDRRALGLLLHEIHRSDATGVTGIHVAAVATAAIAAVDGAFDRARERLDSVPVREPFDLGLAWHAVRVFLARRSEAPADVARALAAARSWAASVAEPVPELESWEGWIAFLSGDYARAERLHRECAQEFCGPRRAQCLLDAGAAALERGAFDAALETAEEAQEALRGHRHPFAAGRIEWLRRAALYRTDRAAHVDEDLVRIAGTIDAPQVVGLTLLTEASVAWRHGRADRAIELADESTRVLVRGGLHSLASVPAGLGLVAGRSTPAEDLQPSFDRLPPALTIQAAELWLRAGVPLDADTRRRVENCWTAVDPSSAEMRREVLALTECGRTRAPRGMSA